MKTKRILSIICVLVFSCALLAACGSKDESGSLVGTWISEDFDGGYVFTFHEDGSGNYNALGTDMPFTYTAKDGTLSVLYDGETMAYETEFTVLGDTFTLKDSTGQDVVYKKK